MARGNPFKRPSIEKLTACSKGRRMMKTLLDINALPEATVMFFSLMIIMSALCMANEDPYEITEEKSRSKATQLSLFGTVLPMAAAVPFLGQGKEIEAANNVAGLTILGLGLFVGPSIGHLYAENKSRAFGGIGIRMLSAGLAVYGLSKIEIFGDDNGGGGLLFSLGGIICIGSAVADIVNAGKSVDKYNKFLSSANLKINPTFFANVNAPGLNVMITF